MFKLVAIFQLMMFFYNSAKSSNLNTSCSLAAQCSFDVQVGHKISANDIYSSFWLLTSYLDGLNFIFGLHLTTMKVCKKWLLMQDGENDVLSASRKTTQTISLPMWRFLCSCKLYNMLDWILGKSFFLLHNFMLYHLNLQTCFVIIWWPTTTYYLHIIL